MSADYDAMAERIIRPQRGVIALNFAELWRYRELFGFLAWRDILLRYKQTYLGVAWVVVQPLVTMVVFTVLFGRFAKFPSHGAPYEILTFAGLLPWQFFANTLAESSNSMVASARIISRVYFPRLIIPASVVFSGFVEAAISFAILLVLMVIYGVSLRPHLLLLPVFLLLTFLVTFAAGVWFSALNVKYRDVRYIVPFITRLGFFVTPVSFLWMDLVPERWRLWYCLNPLVALIDGFRWCVLGPDFPPYWPGFMLSMGVGLILLVTGLVYFRNTERTFADIV
ncbi:MAG TPA: ABC transporter permease [Chthoniobacter sp.]|nr:ABC transporter permease [Chthoniobacter sp.]